MENNKSRVKNIPLVEFGIATDCFENFMLLNTLKCHCMDIGKNVDKNDIFKLMS